MSRLSSTLRSSSGSTARMSSISIGSRESNSTNAKTASRCSLTGTGCRSAVPATHGSAQSSVLNRLFAGSRGKSLLSGLRIRVPERYPHAIQLCKSLSSEALPGQSLPRYVCHFDHAFERQEEKSLQCVQASAAWFFHWRL